MKDCIEKYQKKQISVDEAVAKIGSGMQIFVQHVPEPQTIMDHFHTVANRVANVQVFSVMTTKPYEFIMDPGMKGHFELCSWFHGNGARAGKKAGTVSFVPAFLHAQFDDFLRTRKADIFYGSCTPPDKHGFVSLSIGNTYEKTAIERAGLVIMEVSDRYPRTCGDTEVHIDDIDFFVEGNKPVPTISSREPDEIDLAIGSHIAELVEDESTIQLGIGEIPNAVGKCLKGKKDLGVHTEMLVDSMLELHQLGVITNKKKAFYPGKFVCAFVLGSQGLYDWVDENMSVLVMRGEWVNHPYVVRQNSKMVSINTCIMVDLTGQVMSEAIGSDHYSGTGGQFDTAFGAMTSRDRLGKTIIACRSTAKNGSASSVVSLPPPGTPVTLLRNITDYVVTEYGVARLRGRSVRERVLGLIGISHPKFRDELKEEAAKMGYI